MNKVSIGRPNRLGCWRGALAVQTGWEVGALVYGTERVLLFLFRTVCLTVIMPM